MRMIDANALSKEFAEKCVGECGCCVCAKYDFSCDLINKAPTIDAEPVRHGHWIIHVDELYPADSTQECSVCHGEEWLGIKHENYCPNCGAKMY